MEDGRAPAPRERGWSRIILALAALLLLPYLPPFSAVAPVEHALLLLIPALAACFIAGWRSGGPLALAVVWTALAVWVLRLPAPPEATAYHDVVRAWALLAAGAFGVVSIAGATRALLQRALSALGVAMAIALGLILLGDASPLRVQELFGEHFAARIEAVAAQLRQGAVVAPWMREQTEQVLSDLPRVAALAAPVAPALLALQTLAAFALAWALYHRLSRARLGAPLASLRRFRFNDQLIWGLVAGVTLATLPTLDALRPVGLNLLVFFGGLYVVRGLGVIAWHASAAPGPLRVVGWVVGVLLWPLMLAVALGLGLNDTWFDLRRRDPADRWPPRTHTLF